MNSRIAFVNLVAILLLCGCAFETLDKGLPLLQGKKIDTAISYLGLPDNQMTVAGKNVYVWSNSFTQTSITPVTSYSNASAYGTGGYATAYGTTTTYVPQTAQYSCTIKAVVDKKDIIEGLEYSGNEGGCGTFVDPVKRIISDFGPVP